MPVSKIHNVGFYKLAPSAITCMSYEPNTKKLAVCRFKGNTEIWNVENAAFIEKTFAADTEDSIESICWCNSRLICSKISGYITEYDLYTLKPKQNLPVTSGAAWCLDLNKTKTYLAVGTESGYINLFSLANDEMQFEKLLDRQEGRILCLKYDYSGKYIATGSVDTLRIWNVETGHAIHKMMTGRAQNNQETIVWSIAVTEDLTIISGDSRGIITFWDGNMGTYIESYLSHRADVLSIVVAPDQSTIYCAGIDPIIMSFVKVQLKNNHYKWVKSIQRKIHDHDVRCLVYADDKLYSAGVDGYLAWSSYPPKMLVKYPPLLQNPIISIAVKEKLVLLRYSNYVELWKLSTPLGTDKLENGHGEMVSKILPIQDRPEKLLVLKSYNQETITCAAISDDGNWLVYATNLRLRVYCLSWMNGVFELLPIVVSEDCQSGFRVVFSRNSNYLILATFDREIQIIELNRTLNQINLVQTISVTKQFTDTINILSLSPCGKYLVATDTAGGTSIWKDISKKNSNQPLWEIYCSLPHYICPVTALSIQPETCYLVAAYADQKIIEYNVLQRKFTDFSNTLSAIDNKKWSNRPITMVGVMHDPRTKDCIILYDDTSIYVIDKSKELPDMSAKIARIESPIGDTGVRSLKSKEHGLSIIKKYKHLVYFGYLEGDELIAVEVNPLTFLEQLPPSLKTKQFGVM